MADLIPDSWRLKSDADMPNVVIRQTDKKVTDIPLWGDYYATMVSVLVKKYPHIAQGFMVYL